MLSTKSRKLVFGVFLLLVVDVIWVLSSELTKYLYENERFDKPFFCTYFKTSLFTLYLFVLGLLAPWKETCERRSSYSLVDEALGVCTDANCDGGCVNDYDTDSDGNTRNNYANTSPNSLSDSTFVPIKLDDGCRSSSNSNGVTGSGEEVVPNVIAAGGATNGHDPDGVIAGADATAAPSSAPSSAIMTASISSLSTVNTTMSDGGGGGDASSIKSVRFNRLAEVREMSAHEASEALMARLSYAASIRYRRHRSNHKTARTALLFCILWFIANYLFQLALEPDETALVTLLSSTSSLFTLVLAAIFPSVSGDRLTLSKAVAVLMSVGGVVMVTIADVTEARMSRGIVLALLSALCYAAYLVLVKHKSAVEERINIPLFFGFVGLWNLVLLWPVFFVFNFTQIEVFEWPTQRQWLLLLLNGLVGTVLSEALWLWACFLTSSIIGTIAMTLQIPLSMLFDVLLKGKTFPLMFYAGAVPMGASLLAVALLLRHDDSDPLLRFCKIVYRKVCHCRQPGVVRIVDVDDEQQESLIDSYEQ